MWLIILLSVYFLLNVFILGYEIGSNEMRCNIVDVCLFFSILFFGVIMWAVIFLPEKSRLVFNKIKAIINKNVRKFNS